MKLCSSMLSLAVPSSSLARGVNVFIIIILTLNNRLHWAAKEISIQKTLRESWLRDNAFYFRAGSSNILISLFLTSCSSSFSKEAQKQMKTKALSCRCISACALCSLAWIIGGRGCERGGMGALALFFTSHVLSNAILHWTTKCYFYIIGPSLICFPY